MKTFIIKTITIIVLSLALSGCDKANDEDIVRRTVHINNVQTKLYMICVSFVDADGNDLITSLKPEGKSAIWYGSIDPRLYSLSIILPDGEYYNYGIFTIGNYFATNPRFSTQYGEYDGRNYLMNAFSNSAWGDVDCLHSLNYRISCQSIFGDSSEHEITTYWEGESGVENERTLLSQYPRCTKAYFDGKEVNVKQAIIDHVESVDLFSYFIDIILDK